MEGDLEKLRANPKNQVDPPEDTETAIRRMIEARPATPKTKSIRQRILKRARLSLSRISFAAPKTKSIRQRILKPERSEESDYDNLPPKTKSIRQRILKHYAGLEGGRFDQFPKNQVDPPEDTETYSTIYIVCQ